MTDANLPYLQDLGGAVGAHGLEPAQLAAWSERVAPALAALAADRKSGKAAMLAVADRDDDIVGIQAEADRIRAGAATVVVLGTGGSSLGGQTLVRLVDDGFGPAAGRPRLVFLDNIDPRTVAACFAASDPAKTRFIAISKSGGTAETLAQTLAAIAWLEAAGVKPGDAFTVLTEPKPSPLGDIAARYGMPTLPHDTAIGGRYSALSNVGLLPAAIAGVDIAAVRQGARAALDASLNVAASESPAALGAALSIGLTREQGAGATVLMPYVDALAPFAFWFRQLWAESLGKGGEGTLPANALGAVDQHSQLQLYLDGPKDKLFTLILADKAGQGPKPAAAAHPDLAYLDGRTLGDLLDAEQRATAETLIARGRPTRIFRLGRVDEAAVGALMAHYMAETILSAALLGVDPFDQPAVEDGKVLARQYLGRS